MKRTNLVLNEDLLETATRLLGEKTYSGTVNKALEQAIKLIELRNLHSLFGQNIWEGNLNEMREDSDLRSPQKKYKRGRK